jgi:hypothetical protein
MKRQLLREFISLPQTLTEGETLPNGKLMIKGIIQRAETKNQNNRIYPRSLLMREIESYQKAVKENRAVGELDHPESSTVSFDRVSHIVREMNWNGNDVHGIIEVLDTPKGQILKTLYKSGVAIGISSRGVGSTSKNESGCDTVQDDFNLVAFDIVSEPSTPGAYLREGKEIDWEPNSVPRVDRVNRAIIGFLNGKKQ